MKTEWFIKNDEEVQGPYDSREVAKLAATGVLGPNDMVRKGEDGQWSPANRVRGLSFNNQERVGTSTPPPTTAPKGRGRAARRDSNAHAARCLRYRGASHLGRPDTGIADPRPVGPNSRDHR